MNQLKPKAGVKHERGFKKPASEDFKKSPNFLKVAQTVPKPKNAKISTSKFNMKIQIIYIEPLLKPYNVHNKPCFETDYLRKNLKICLSKKQLKLFQFLWANSYFQKSTISFQKWPNWQKHPIWLLWLICTFYVCALCEYLSGHLTLASLQVIWLRKHMIAWNNIEVLACFVNLLLFLMRYIELRVGTK